MQKTTHFLMIPFTGLGLYGGFRGNHWLCNRIKVFKQFVIPSLIAQTNQDFVLWIAWRWEERDNPHVKELKSYIKDRGLKSVFTYSGVPFWDDKYPDDIARNRLIAAIHGSMGELTNVIGENDYVLMTIQPSDDCYHKDFVKNIQSLFDTTDVQVLGFRKGYIMDYIKGELAEYNPFTIPPFFTIKFPRIIFTDPLKHLEYTGPYKSHEYIGDKLKFGEIGVRGFLVGIHGANISTVFDHPFRGKILNSVETVDVLKDFGLSNTAKLVLPFSLRSAIFRKLPYKIKRKLRYLASEKRWIFKPFFAIIYNILRA